MQWIMHFLSMNEIYHLNDYISRRLILITLKFSLFLVCWRTLQIAQQYWAHFFYNRLHDLDDHIDIEDLYHSYCPVWEGIFQIIEPDKEIKSTD